MGHNTKIVIHINGKRYDALSGAVVQSVDGIRSTTAPLVPAAKRAAHAPAAHIPAHKPQRAATLMRSAVKKPDLRSKKITAQSPTSVLSKLPVQQIAPKLSHASIDPTRQKRARRVMQSPAVSRFGNVSTVDSLSTGQSTLAALTPNVPLSNVSLTPNAPRQIRQSADTPNKSIQPIRHVTKQPDIFEQALARATSHEQQPHAAPRSKKRGRTLTAVSFGLLVVLSLGVFAYFNAPELSLRLASSRAGFEARLPSYSPAGFSFGNLTYSPGNVSVNYQNGDNASRKFGITQRVSNWDSEGLLSNFVSSAASAYQTYERAGRTVYFYGDNSATWVDSGVWYIIDGSNSLTKNQVLDMAGSL